MGLPLRGGSRAVGVAGFAVIAIIGVVVTYVATAGSYAGFTAIIVVATLTLVSIPILRRIAGEDHALFKLLLLALAVKFLATLVRYYVGSDLYGGRVDATGYVTWGLRIMDAFRAGHYTTGLRSMSDTDFIRFLTGLVFTAIGPAVIAGYFVFSWLGFWGLVCFERAFAIAVPSGRRATYDKLIFFLPSLAFWPSSIGKESWMIFALGLASLGVARILTSGFARGLIPTLLGLWFAGLVRPHMAGLAGVCLAIAYVVRRPKAELRELGPVVKIVSLAILGVLAGILVVRATAFLTGQRVSTNSLSTIASSVNARSSEGGSSFQAHSVLQSPLYAPVAVVTVLFRPLVVEAHNIQSLAAALEGTFLLGLSIVRWRWFVSALRSARQEPYVAFALLYTLLFIAAYSSFGNFGLLVRERVQLTPLYLVLLSIPAADRSGKGRPGSEHAGRDVVAR